MKSVVRGHLLVPFEVQVPTSADIEDVEKAAKAGRLTENASVSDIEVYDWTTVK